MSFRCGLSWMYDPCWTIDLWKYLTFGTTKFADCFPLLYDPYCTMTEWLYLKSLFHIVTVCRVCYNAVVHQLVWNIRNIKTFVNFTIKYLLKASSKSFSKLNTAILKNETNYRNTVVNFCNRWNSILKCINSTYSILECFIKPVPVRIFKWIKCCIYALHAVGLFVNLFVFGAN